MKAPSMECAVAPLTRVVGGVVTCTDMARRISGDWLV